MHSESCLQLECLQRVPLGSKKVSKRASKRKKKREKRRGERKKEEEEGKRRTIVARG